MANRTPAGFSTNGRHRPIMTGRKVAESAHSQSGWPYAVDCPSCPAKRYEKCYRWQGVNGLKFNDDDIRSGATDEVKFMYIKDVPCGARVRLVRKRDDNEGEIGEVIDDDYPSGDS